MTERPPVNIVTAAAGLCFVALGILLLLQRAGHVELRQILDLWPVALVVLGGALAWQATRGGQVQGNSGGAIAALFWLGLLGLLFGYTADRTQRSELQREPGRVSAVAIMGGQKQFDRTGPLYGGMVTTVMGGAVLDLRQMEIGRGEEAVLDLFTVFGGTEIRVPREWTVELAATTVMGGVDDARSGDDWVEPESTEDASATGEMPPTGEVPVTDEIGSTSQVEPVAASSARPRLVITGTIVMGGLKILN